MHVYQGTKQGLSCGSVCSCKFKPTNRRGNKKPNSYLKRQLNVMGSTACLAREDCYEVECCPTIHEAPTLSTVSGVSSWRRVDALSQTMDVSTKPRHRAEYLCLIGESRSAAACYSIFFCSPSPHNRTPTYSSGSLPVNGECGTAEPRTALGLASHTRRQITNNDTNSLSASGPKQVARERCHSNPLPKENCSPKVLLRKRNLLVGEYPIRRG